MKKIFFLATAMTAMLATSCSNEDNVTNEDNSGKTRIALSAGDDVVRTRAGFTNQTRIVARIVSDKRGGGTIKSVKTVLLASAEESAGTYSKVSYAENKTRYWDDAYGRSSILSVYAVAIPNKNDGTAESNLKETVLKGGDSWAEDATPDNTISWTLKSTQAYSDLANEDLTYSNNIQEGNVGGNSVYTWNYVNGAYPAENPSNATKHGTDPNIDGRLYFTQSADYTAALNDGPGHFDKGQMEFKHSLTRIQVNLIKGEGFTSAPFSVTTMKVLGQSVSGTFNIKSASWSDKATATPVDMAVWSSPASSKAATYEAQVLPGYVFAADATNVLSMIVDGNNYYVTNQMLRTALTDKSGVNAEFSTEMGKRYVFDITVKKNQIENITATIIDWNDVTAANTDVDNSHLTFSFYNNGTACTDINLYKYMEDLGKVYTDNSYTADPVAGSAYTEVEELTPDGSTGKYKTSEFYQDNQTAYHFRSINNVAEGTLATGKTYFTMTSGEAAMTNDYHWGAPMKESVSTDKLPYSSTDGYLSSIAKGIVAASTTSTINLTEIHMMSQVVVKLTTPTGGAAVNLAGATVTLTRISNTGDVDMGSGKITPTTSYTNSSTLTVSTDDDVTSCTFNVVPQELKRGTNDADYVGITIHTTDNNEYYIVKKLSEITASTVGTQVTNLQTKDAAILEWFPGHKYIYTFNITKTEIKNITATIVGWNEVNAGNTNLDLEK